MERPSTEVSLCVVGAGLLAERIAGIDIDAAGLPIAPPDAERFRALGLRSLEKPTEPTDGLDVVHAYLLDLPEEMAVDETLDRISRTMQPGDIVLDPTTSYWGDTLRRWRRLRHRAIYCLDLAMLSRAGGPLCVLGGDDKGAALVLPIVQAIMAPVRAVHLGPASLAHYAAMVDDALALTVRQACSEAAQLLEAWPGSRHDAAPALWSPGEPRGLARGFWLLDDALRLEMPVPVMAQGIMQTMAEALDELRSEPPPARLGPFVTPDELD